MPIPKDDAKNIPAKSTDLLGIRMEAKKLSLIRKVLIKGKSFNITERSCKCPSKHHPRTTQGQLMLQFSFIEGLLKVLKVLVNLRNLHKEFLCGESSHIFLHYSQRLK